MLDAPDLTFTPTTGSGSGGNAAGNDYDECQRQLEQLAQLQQRYDTLAIDDLVARKQKELEIERATNSLPSNQTNLVMKIFGTVGGAVEYVFHNRKWLFSIGKAIKGVF